MELENGPTVRKVVSRGPWESDEAVMEKLDSEYPTEEQIRELFEARKKPGAIAEILRKRQGQEAPETGNGVDGSPGG
jgi:hypothetical protein